MGPIYLLDTNILSEQVKKNPDPKVLDFLEKNEDYLATCSLVMHELQFGMEILENKKKKKLLGNFIESIKDTLPILDYDTKAASFHAKEKSRLSKIGKTPPFVDGQIAAIAQVNNLKLVTKNTKDFKLFKIEIVGF